MGSGQNQQSFVDFEQETSKAVKAAKLANMAKGGKKTDVDEIEKGRNCELSIMDWVNWV